MLSRSWRGQRLRTKADFDRVFRRGRRLDGRLFQLVVAPNTVGWHRLGLAVSRRLGGAVQRNRARRLLRESFRQWDGAQHPSLDIVVVPREAMAGRGLPEVRREWNERLAKAFRGGKTPSGGR